MFFKKIAIVVFAMSFAFSTACSNGSEKSNTETKDVASATLNAEAPATAKSVFQIKTSTIGDQVLPDFTWEENGITIKFSDYIKDKVVFINFWGTWCPPCRAEIPYIIQLQKEFKDKDFVVVGFALERSPDASNVQKFSDAKGINYINFMASRTDKTAMEIVGHFGQINAVPTTMIFNKKGEKVETIVGGRDYKSFKASIEKAM